MDRNPPEIDDRGLRVPATMSAWVLGGPGEMILVEKPVPEPGPAEALVRVDAIAVCATDLEVRRHGHPAMIDGELPFNKNFTMGHEYMGTVVRSGPGVDEVAAGQRVAVEVHAGCGRCRRCRHGMYTACLNYGYAAKGHRANGFTSDGGFAQYALNHVNTLVPISPAISDANATLIVTAGTALYGLDTLGGLIAGDGVAITGGGPIGLMGVAVAKALGAAPVVLTDIRDDRLAMGTSLGADHVINAGRQQPVAAVRKLTNGHGIDLVLECSGAPGALGDAVAMVNRGGRVCLAAFADEPVLVDAGRMVSDNISVFGIRAEGRGAVRRAAALMEQGLIDPAILHTHSFGLEDVPKAMDHAEQRIDGAVKVVVFMR